MLAKKTVEQKREYVNWLTKYYKSRNPNGDLILKSLVTDQLLASNIKFVQDIYDYPYGLIIRYVGTTGEAIVFREDGRIKTNIQEIYYEIRRKKMQKIYVQIELNTKMHMEKYKEVIEEEKEIKEGKEKLEMKKYAEEVMQESIRIGNEKRVRKEMDIALDKRDFEKAKKIRELLN